MFTLRRSLLTLGSLSVLLVARSALAADATITGTVTHAADGTGVDTILVYAENYDTGISDYDYTDTNGSYSITIDDTGAGTAGQYLVYNYTATNEEPNVVFTRTATTVTLTDGENRTGVNLSLTRRARAQGYVYESDGTTPVYGALVYYLRDTVWTDGYGADYTTAGGFYSVAPAPYPNPTTSATGTYTVQVTNPGYFGAEIEDVVLATDETTITQNLSLTAASTVSGTITDSTGTPLADVDVVLDDDDSYYTYRDTTDSSGNYSIMVFDQYDYNGTAVGNYTLTASADNYVSQSQSLAISADESSNTGSNFTLRRAGRMNGTVVTEAGTVLTNATITVNDGLGNSYTTTTDANGNFTFSNLTASQSYTVTITIDGYLTTTLYDVAVVTDETTDFDDAITLDSAVSFSGEVVERSGGDAISGTTIELFDRAKPRSTVPDYTLTTISDGTFSSNQIIPGNYRVEVSQAGYVTLLRNRINLTSSVADKTFRLETGATITGLVRNDGEPVYQALVTVYSKNPSSTGYGYDYTDSDGYYAISSLEPGRYRVKVSSTGFTERVLQRRLRSGQTTEVNLAVGEAGSVAGYVTDKLTNLPLAGYLVRVRNQTVSAYTDTNGYYIIDGLAPGRYKLYVYSTAYKTGRSNKIRVRSNRVMQPVNFVLQPK